MEPIQSLLPVSIPAPATAIQFDLAHLFLQAHIVVQLVLVGLLIASVLTWAIVFERWIAIARERRAASRFEKLFWSGQSLEEIERTVTAKKKAKAMGSMFLAALKEWRLSSEGGAELNMPSFRERVQSTMEVDAQKSVSRLETGLLFLATIGAAGPFIGLFGTVWGIMNAFTAIASAQNATLAVVAPGIAEALSTTALGLVAAIPAVIFYNKFSSDISGFGARLEMFSREFWSTISRELDLTAPHSGDVKRGTARYVRDNEQVGQPAH
jgi:biopolymer transport protein TolQ